MNPRAVVFTLLRDLNKFIVLNIVFFLLTLSGILYLLGYDYKETMLMITFSFIFALSFNFILARVMRRNVEKIIQKSFEKVENQLYFDELTSVYNRTTGINRLKEEISRAHRSGSPLSIAMVDIDNFKSINDTYGHVIGDRVLNHVAVQMKNFLRSCDVVSRYGGEEFLVVLPETDEIKAYMAMERVRRGIAKKPVRVGQEKIYITVSIGITEVQYNEDITESINRADMALYQAKKSGKNRIDIQNSYSQSFRLS
ncbi:GGDEF domain-containing protein [Thermodesulfovibrio sp.]|jgi:diguanylate cyclase (GGDEF)-like protein|uniref:GGDEF domain-containing protein n=1 Tax=Thermodesulfovibrio TaxID=28261 RepID=UPI0026060314|nr:GGDEF domain-containing protein [Thermodesulfovibrio sp.]